MLIFLVSLCRLTLQTVSLGEVFWVQGMFRYAYFFKINSIKRELFININLLLSFLLVESSELSLRAATPNTCNA